MALPSGSSSGRGAGGVVSSVGYIGVVEAAMRSVGVEPAEEECDPLVVAALMECSRRVVSEILRDAKDLSVHAGRQEIGLRDVRLAVGMMDQRVTDTAALGGERLRTTVAREINSRPLLLAGPNRPGVIAAPQGAGGVDPSSQCSIPKHAVRMVPEINSSLLKRSFSYIPGGDAYESAASSSSSGAGGADLSSTSAGAGAAASSSAVLAGVSQAALMRMLLPPTAPRIQMSLASSSSSSASGGGVAAGAAASGAGVKRARGPGPAVSQAGFGDD